MYFKLSISKKPQTNMQSALSLHITKRQHILKLEYFTLNTFF